ncbi:MAG: TIGR03960 family B12-binding radical SAM protein [Clostridiales bacterium]|nr:TIGR03960 family B12-binding radical SAM protein [Clostridiales bacterium]
MNIDIKKQLDKLLKRVEKPGRYIGGEVNSVMKDPSKMDVNFCFCFPDIYEIGMSYLGLQIIYKTLNDQPNVYCQRAFQPQNDMEELMREEGMPLFSLEQKTLLRDMDMVGFTLQYEMSYTTVLNMIDLAGIPMFSKDRGEDMPLVLAGGPCAYDPEPLWEFVDCFLIGDGEKLLPEFTGLYAEMKSKGTTKEEFLKEAVKLQGVYVPAFYDVKYNEDGTISELCKLYDGAPDKVKRAILSEIESLDFPVEPIIPMVEAVHDRAVVETFRGCTRGCRFCQAGMIYRPVRERTREHVMELALKELENTGHEELSLLSLSTSDHTEFETMALDLVECTKARQVSLSLPSLRIDKFAFNVLQRIQEFRKSGLTYAPEAGTQRLRDVINKGVTENDIYTSVRQALELGWTHIKLYFMIGLPTETYEDLDGIVEIAKNIRDLNYEINGKKGGRFKLTVSVSNFVPKADTPFQWEAQDTAESFRLKHNYLAERLKDKRIIFNYHDNETSSYEAVFARGDRRTSRLLYEAWKLGCKLDGWSEHYRPDLWEQAFKKSGIDRDFYTTRKRSFDEIFAWDHIDCLVTKDFLMKEAKKAYDAQITHDCRYGCVGCGINREVKCEKGGIYHV